MCRLQQYVISFHSHSTMVCSQNNRAKCREMVQILACMVHGYPLVSVPVTPSLHPNHFCRQCFLFSIVVYIHMGSPHGKGDKYM